LGECVETKDQATIRNFDVITRDFARRLRQDFALYIAHNPRDFKKQVIRLIRRELPPRRGRPVSPQIEAALAMVQQGKTVPEVLRAQVSGFEQLDTYGRYLMEKALRQAMSRRRRHRNSSLQEFGFRADRYSSSA